MKDKCVCRTALTIPGLLKNKYFFIDQITRNIKLSILMQNERYYVTSIFLYTQIINPSPPKIQTGLDDNIKCTLSTRVKTRLDIFI